MRPMVFVCPILWIMGTPKARVFPVPVWAIPMISFPSIATGIAFSCIGVGVVNFKFAIISRSRGAIPRPVNDAEEFRSDIVMRRKPVHQALAMFINRPLIAVLKQDRVRYLKFFQ